MSKTPKIVAILLYVAGAILLVGGAGTWYSVSDQLAAENITVTEDASCQAGQAVNGPLEAYCMADIINQHALEATGRTNGATWSALVAQGPTPALQPATVVPTCGACSWRSAPSGTASCRAPPCTAT